MTSDGHHSQEFGRHLPKDTRFVPAPRRIENYFCSVGGLPPNRRFAPKDTAGRSSVRRSRYSAIPLSPRSTVRRRCGDRLGHSCGRERILRSQFLDLIPLSGLFVFCLLSFVLRLVSCVFASLRLCASLSPDAEKNAIASRHEEGISKFSPPTISTPLRSNHFIPVTAAQTLKYRSVKARMSLLAPPVLPPPTN